MAFVYLMCDSGQDNCFKIGVTRGAIEKRMKKLQTGNGEEIFLADYFETEYPFFIERMMHQRYFSEKKLNEWFTLTAEEKSRFKADCMEFEQMANELKDNVFFKNKLK